MVGFPDESRMERSADNSEPIRGGSIGLNRILGSFLKAARIDARPRYNAVLISAFTIFRNVWTMNKDGRIGDLEDGFIKDVNLFLEYFDEYLSSVWGRLPDNKFCPVVIYFPDYKTVPKEILRDHTGQTAALFSLYDKFSDKHSGQDGEIRKLIHTRCYSVKVGNTSYPHRELVRKFRDIASNPHCLYTTGDPVCLITHITLDCYISSRLRGIQLLESYTAKTRKPDEFRLRLDKEGRVPFQPAVHVIFGDAELIAPMVSPKIKKLILEEASKDRWLSRSEEDVRNRIIRITKLPSGTFRKYDFL